MRSKTKRFLICLLALVCLLAPLLTAQAEGLGALFERFKADPPVFPAEVRRFTTQPSGCWVDYTELDGWIITRGYFPEYDRYCLIGHLPDGTRTAMTQSLPAAIIPAGDAFIYFDPDQAAWLIRKPGMPPEELALNESDEVISADHLDILYTKAENGETVICTLKRTTGEKAEIGRIPSLVVGRLSDGGLLTVDFDANCVQHWKDGETSTLLETEEPIYSVVSNVQSTWIELEHEFGLLENGSVSWRLPGSIFGTAGTTDQYVFLLAFPGSDKYDVVLFNDRFRAYTRVGSVLASDTTFAELMADGTITVWGPEESLIFEVPPPSQWIPYGHYDVVE